MATATDSRASEPVERPRTAATTPAAAGVHAERDRATAARCAPTEAEIREAVAAATAAARRGPHSDEFGEWVYMLSAPLSYTPPDEDPPVGRRGLWDNLRPSEAEELAEIREAVYCKADELFWTAVLERIGELVVAAALEFGAAHPDAPRAAWG